MLLTKKREKDGRPHNTVISRVNGKRRLPEGKKEV